MEEVNQEVISSGREVQTISHQLSELRREYQNLEIELQAQISTVRDGLRFCPRILWHAHVGTETKGHDLPFFLNHWSIQLGKIVPSQDSQSFVQ